MAGMEKTSKNPVNITEFIDSILKDQAMQKWWMIRHGSLDEFLVNLDKPVKIYGASKGGQYVKNILEKKGAKIFCFVDSDPAKWGGKLDQLPVLSPGELCQGDVVAISSMYQNEIVPVIKDSGLYAIITYDDFLNDIRLFNRDFVVKNKGVFEEYNRFLADADSREILLNLVYFYLTRDPFSTRISPYVQYSHPEVKANSGDKIFDVGAFNGDSIELFMNDSNNNCSIYAFEPSAANCEEISALVKKKGWQDKINIIQKAVGDVTGTTLLELDQFSPQYNKTGQHKGLEVPLLSIDYFVKTTGIVPDLIKVDVEGYDEKVVRGAMESIAYYKPKLQIALYHHPDHFINIPQLIRKANPGYRFYLGHHRGGCWDTVLYAFE